MKEKLKCNCADCQKDASYFHSKCCNAHFEGVIDKYGRLFIACEKCGRICAGIETP